MTRGDRILAGAGVVAAGLILLAFGAVVFDLFKNGLGSMSLGFFTEEVGNSGRSGGIGPILVSTAMILCVCLIASLPIGIGTALWLSEFSGQSRRGKFVTAIVDVLASVPSIVFGLFGMVFFCETLKLGFSIASGGLTLACMVLPIIIRTTLIGLKSVPSDLRAGSAVLGISRVSTIRHLLLPAAVPGIIVGATLGISRAMAETAALIFTSGYATRWPESFKDSGRAISVHIYDLAMNIPGGAEKAAASALTLLLVLLVINFLASSIGDRFLKSQRAL